MKTFVTKNKLNFWNISKKVFWKNTAIFFFLFFVLVFMDQIFKMFFFNSIKGNFVGDRVHTFQWLFIGIISLEHEGLTSALPLNSLSIQILSLIFLIIIIPIIFFSKNSWLTIFLTILLSGIFGNLLDRLIFDGKVKDIFFIGYNPFLNSGIFNFADIFAVLGSILIFLFLIWIGFFQNWVLKKIKKYENNFFKNKDSDYQIRKIEKKFYDDFNDKDYENLFNDKSTTLIVNKDKTIIDIDLKDKHLKKKL